MTMQKYTGPKRLRSVLSLLCSAMLLAACASSGGSQYAAAECPVPETGNANYVIGPGDTLQIVVWRNVELTTTIPVRPDGRISTPLVDDMMASGKTPSQLSVDMEAVLGEYLRTPEVSVIVTQQGAANQIQIVGEVMSPQSISYREGLRILDVVVAVGGLSDYAAGNRGNLVRQMDSGQIECRLKIKSLMAGDMTQNIQVFPGDVLIIPETRF